MSDLSYTVEVKGIEDLARLESTLDKLQGTLNAGKGSGKALEEVRKILVGMKGTPSVLEDLSSSIQNLGNATQSLERTFKSSLGGLARTLVTELKAVQASVATQGREMGMETGRAMSEGFELTGKGVVKKAKSIAAQARAAATAEYEKLVGKNPNAELTEQMAATISNLKAQGAQISNIHSYIVKEWEKYGTLTSHQISAASAKINAAQEKRLNDDKKFADAQAAAIAAARKELERESASETAWNKQTAKSDDKVRALLGLPSVAEMEAVKASILQKHQEITEAIKASADETSWNLKTAKTDDKVRALLGLPSVADMEAVKASILQKQEEIVRTVKASSDETAWNIKTAKSDDKVRALLGLPTVAEMDSIKSSILQRHAEIAAAVRESASETSWNTQTAKSDDKVRRLLGLPSVAEMEAVKATILQKHQEIANAIKASAEESAWDKKTAKSDDKVRRLLGLPSTDDTSRAFRDLRAQIEQHYKVLESLKNAKPEGPYSVISTKELVQVKQRFQEAGAAAYTASKQFSLTSPVFKRMELDARNTHSAMRGLASGFNMLWLTWGKLAPLFAGAGVSFTLKKAFDVGSEVEYQIRFMEELGQTTDETGKRMAGAAGIIRDQLRNLNKESQFSIVELSKAMTDLGQAGYSVGETFQILKPAAALATAGMVNLETASKTLIQVNALFGRTANETAKTASQLFQITKSGVLNVEDLAGAFRYASETNTRFEGTLEETLVIFGSLAQAGIKGQAAGTAMINLYRDVFGRSGPAIKAMEQLRKATGDQIKLFDELGNKRSIVDIFDDISTAINKIDPVKADQILGKLFSARGGRSYFAMERENVEKLRASLEELAKIDPQTVFNAQRGLMDTTKGAVHILAAGLTNSLDLVFDAYEDKFKEFIVSINRAVDSDEFRLGLAQIIGTASKLFDLIKNNTGTVATFFAAWAGWKVISTGVSVFSTLGTAIIDAQAKLLLYRNTQQAVSATEAAAGAATQLNTASKISASQAALRHSIATQLVARGLDKEAASAIAATIATNAYAASAGKAGAASRALGAAAAFMANPLVGVITTLGILAATYLTTRSTASEALDGMGRASDDYSKIATTNLTKEIALITRRNRLLEEADDYSGVEQELKQRSVKLQEKTKSAINIIQHAEDVRGEVHRANAIRERDAFLSQLKDEENAINAAYTALDEARAQTAKDREDRQRRAEEREKKRLAELTKNFPKVDVPDAGSGGKPYFERAELDRSNERKKIEEDYASKLSLAKDYYTKEKALLDAQFNAKLISESEYYSRSAASALEHEQDQIRILQEGLEKRTAASLEVITELQAKQASVKPSSKAWKDYAQQIENIENEVVSYTVKATNEIEKVKTESAHRLSLVTIKLAGETAQLIEKDKEFWEDSRRSQEKEAALKAIERQYNNVSKSVFSTGEAEKASALAIVKVNEETKKHIDTLKEKLKLQRANLEAAQAAALIALQDPTIDEARRDVLAEQVRVAQKAVQDLEKVLEDSVEKGLRKGAEAGADAFNDVMYQNAMKFRDELSDILYDAITGNGASAGKALREMLKRELIKEPLTVAIRGVVGSVVGSLFGGGSGGIGAAGGGGIGSILSGANTLSSVYGAFSGGLTSGLAGTIGSLGSMFGSSALTSFAAGMKGATLAPGLMGPTTAGATGAMGAGSAFAAAMPWLVGLSALAAAWKPLFGRKLKDSGLEGTFGGESGFEGRMYEFYKGGLFRSNKTKYKDLDSGLQKMLATQFEALKKGATEMGVILGVSADALDNFSSSIKVSFHGLSEEEVQKKLEEELDKLTESMAQQIIGSWETTTEEVQRMVWSQTLGEDTAVMRMFTGTQESQRYVASEFAREGERAHETLARLSVSLSAVNSMFDMLAYSLYEASFAGGDLASKLVDLFGGLENMTNATGAFFRNFYSAEEQREYARRMIEKQLAELELMIPDIDSADAREQWRKLAESQDLTTESGQKAWAVIMQLSEAFSEITQTAEEAAAAARDLAEEQERQRQEAIRKAQDNLRKAIERDKSLIQERMSVFEEAIRAVSSAIDMLKANARELYGAVDSTAQMLAAQGMVYIEMALAGVRSGGKLAEYTELEEAVRAARSGVDGGIYISQFDRDRDRLVLAGQLSELAELGEGQLTFEERQLRVLQEQIEYLNRVAQQADDLINGVDRLDGTVDFYLRALLNLLGPDKTIPENGTKPSGPSYGGIQTGSRAPSSDPRWQDGKGYGSGYASDPNRFSVEYDFGRGKGYHDVTDASQTAKLRALREMLQVEYGSGTAEDLARVAAKAKAMGATQADIASALGFWVDTVRSEFSAVGIPAFAVGTNYVPRDMLAYLHEGETVVPKAFNPWAGGRTFSDNSDVVFELQSAREELAQVTRALITLVGNTSGLPEFVDQFDNVTEGGNMLRVDSDTANVLEL